MSTSERDQLIKTYIGRILDRQSQKKETLQGDELRAIAKEVGLSEQEIAAVEQEAKDHFDRGQGFVRYSRWDDAITELKEALSLSPASVEITHALALAYQRRYQDKQNKADKEEARRLAKQTLELAPKHEPSFALLNALDQKPAPKPSSSIVSALVLGALVFPVIGGLGYLLTASTDSESPRARGLLSLPPVKTPTPYVPSTPIKDNADVEPEIEFEAGEKGEGLTFTNRGTILNNYADSSYLKVTGDIENKSDKEYSEIKLQIQMMDASGNVVEAAVVDAFPSYQAAMRPGDVRGFYTIKKTSPTIERLKITVQTTKTQPAPSAYDMAKPVEPAWAFTRPSHLLLLVGERSTRFSQYTTNAYHEAIFEFTNSGDGAITALKIQLSYFDKDDNLLSTDESYVISTGEPSMLPGQTRPHKTIESVSTKFDHYTMTIIEAQ